MNFSRKFFKTLIEHLLTRMVAPKYKKIGIHIQISFLIRFTRILSLHLT
jgi:hypothetical protein